MVALTPGLKWIGGAAAVAVVAVGLTLYARGRQPAPFLPASARGCGSRSAPVTVGQPVPLGCTVESLPGGAATTLAEVAAKVSPGTPLVVNFWASWCGACIQEMPDLQKVYASAGARVQFLGLDLLGVDGETRAGAEAFSRQRAVTYPLAYDDSGLLYSRISLRVLPPTTIFLRGDGTLAGVNVGQLSAADLRSDLQRFLGVAVPA